MVGREIDRADEHGNCLLQTRRASKYSTRRAQQIVTKYDEEVGVRHAPHVSASRPSIRWINPTVGKTITKRKP